MRVHADAYCRDVINLRAEKESEGKVFKITLLASKGAAREIEVADNEYILDAADRQNIDLPATCRGGICGCCVARIVSGETDASDIADLSFTLTDEEQASGMGLLCMTRAKSDLVIETQCDWGYSLGLASWQGASGLFEAAPDPLMGEKWSEADQKQE
jgi:ferredoxin